MSNMQMQIAIFIIYILSTVLPIGAATFLLYRFFKNRGADKQGNSRKL